jgi:tetratricopeptide (TPR) repeat protein
MDKSGNPGTKARAETYAKARENAEKMLKKAGLNTAISIEAAENIIREYADDIAYGMTVFFELLEKKISAGDSTALMDALNDLYNHTPQEFLDGKSPYQKEREPQSAMAPKHFVIESSNRDDDFNFFVRQHEKATQSLQKKKFDVAISEFDDGFEILLRKRIIFPEIYRTYANYAIAMFGTGDRELALHLVESAIELNPNYDFALTVRKNYEMGLYDTLPPSPLLASKHETKPAMTWETSAACRYFEFLKRLGINFATAELTETEMKRLR